MLNQLLEIIQEIKLFLNEQHIFLIISIFKKLIIKNKNEEIKMKLISNLISLNIHFDFVHFFVLVSKFTKKSLSRSCFSLCIDLIDHKNFYFEQYKALMVSVDDKFFLTIIGFASKTDDSDIINFCLKILYEILIFNKEYNFQHLYKLQQDLYNSELLSRLINIKQNGKNKIAILKILEIIIDSSDSNNIKPILDEIVKWQLSKNNQIFQKSQNLIIKYNFQYSDKIN